MLLGGGVCVTATPVAMPRIWSNRSPNLMMRAPRSTEIEHEYGVAMDRCEIRRRDTLERAAGCGASLGPAARLLARLHDRSGFTSAGPRR